MASSGGIFSPSIRVSSCSVVTVSEPFMTALVQHCVSAISGYGTPDYPKIVKNAIEEDLKRSLLDDEQN